MKKFYIPLVCMQLILLVNCRSIISVSSNDEIPKKKVKLSIKEVRSHSDQNKYVFTLKNETKDTLTTSPLMTLFNTVGIISPNGDEGEYYTTGAKLKSR